MANDSTLPELKLQRTVEWFEPQVKYNAYCLRKTMIIQFSNNSSFESLIDQIQANLHHSGIPHDITLMHEMDKIDFYVISKRDKHLCKNDMISVKKLVCWPEVLPTDIVTDFCLQDEYIILIPNCVFGTYFQSNNHTCNEGRRRMWLSFLLFVKFFTRAPIVFEFLLMLYAIFFLKFR